MTRSQHRLLLLTLLLLLLGAEQVGFAAPVTDPVNIVITKSGTPRPGWDWAQDHNAFQYLERSVTDHGYTFAVHRALAGPNLTQFFCSIEGPNLEGRDFRIRASLNGTPVAAYYAQWVRYQHSFDGGIAFVFVTVGFPQAGGDLQLVAQGVADHDLQIEFPFVPESAEAQVIAAVDKTFTFGDCCRIRVKQVVFSPFATTLEYVVETDYGVKFYSSPGFRDAILAADGNTLSPMLRNPEGWYYLGWPIKDYRPSLTSRETLHVVYYEPVYPLPNQLTLTLGAEARAPLFLPLLAGASIDTPDGRQITVTDATFSGNTGTVTISLPGEPDSIIDDIDRLNVSVVGKETSIYRSKPTRLQITRTNDKLLDIEKRIRWTALAGIEPKQVVIQNNWHYQIQFTLDIPPMPSSW